MPFRASPRYRSALFLVPVLLVVRLSFAQNAPSPSTPAASAGTDSGDSLGAVTRRAKAQKKVHAARVVTDEDVRAGAGPLPRLKLTEAENGEDVVEAIIAYQKTHTSEQTADAIHRWYEESDELLAAAIQENIDVRTLRETNVDNGYELCQQSHDYEKCETRRNAEQRGARHDQAEISRNNDLIVRVQHSLMNIRNRMAQLGLRYDWFKVRTTNNIDRF